MKKIYLISIPLLLLISILVLTQERFQFWKSNKFHIEFGKGLDSDSLKIYSGNHSVALSNFSIDNFKNDLNRFTLIYNEGKQISDIKDFYGENDFILLYNERNYLIFRHIKLNDYSKHKYNITLNKRDDKIIAHIKITGTFAIDYSYNFKSIKVIPK